MNKYNMHTYDRFKEATQRQGSELKFYKGPQTRWDRAKRINKTSKIYMYIQYMCTDNTYIIYNMYFIHSNYNEK